MAKTAEAQSIAVSKFQLFLQEISAIANEEDPMEIALLVIDHTCKVLDCDRTSFFFVDGDYLDLVIAKGATHIRMPKTAGFAGECASKGEIVNIPDAYEDKRFNSKFDKQSGYHTKQILCVPVQDPDKSIVGVLQAINKNSDSPFDNVDEALLVSIAQQVGVALRYAEQAEEARHAKDQKNALIKFIRSINTSSTVASVLFTLNNAASELLNADRCTFYVIDHLTKSMHIASADSSVDITLPLGKGIAGTVAVEGKTTNIPDAYADERFDQSWDVKTGYRTKCMVCMPVWPESQKDELKEDLKPCAVVQLINKTDGGSHFTKDDEELLEVLLRFLSPLVSGSSLFQKKKKQKEYAKLQDLSKKSLQRLPSQEISGLDAATIVEEEEEEQDDW